MPKDKKAASKKEGSSNEKSKKEEYEKRRNSLTDDSITSTSSSSSSSSSSSNVSSTESESAVEKNKGTMAREEDLANNCKKDGKKFVIDPCGNAPKQPITVVNDRNSVPVTESTHIHVIRDDYKHQIKIGSKSIPPASIPSSSNSNSRKKKNQKERKLTKKEKREQLISNGTIAVGTNTGSQEYQDGYQKKILADIVKREGGELPQVSLFDEFGDDEKPIGNMTVRSINSAAFNAFGEKTDIPFYGREKIRISKNEAPQRHYLDAMEIGKNKFLERTTIGNYTNYSAQTRMSMRMGFGISATGLHDSVKSITLKKTKHLMNQTYSEHAEASYSLDNWRMHFAATVQHETITPDLIRRGQTAQIMANMTEHIRKIVNEQPDPWRKRTMQLVLQGDVRQIVERVKEIDRVIRKKEMQRRYRARRNNERPPKKSDDKEVEYAKMQSRERFKVIVKMILSWMTSEYLEHAPDHIRIGIKKEKIHVMRGCSVIMYLSSTPEDELMCFRNNHRKCTMLSFILGCIDTEVRRKVLLHSFTNSFTPLHFAALTGMPCQLDVLLNYGCGTEVTSDYQMTPLYYAARRPSCLMAQQLIWHGADLAAVDRKIDSSMVDLEFAETSVNGYFSRKFVLERHEALQDIYLSYLNMLVGEIDPRVIFKVRLDDVRSHLHICRIGATVVDRFVSSDREVYIKEFMVKINTAKMRGPLYLALIPASYTKMDTTMRSTFPHLVRIPMIQRADKLAYELDAANSPWRFEKDATRRDEMIRSAIASAPIAKLLNSPPVLIFGDYDSGREMAFESFLSNEYNSDFYMYVLPESAEQRPCYREKHPHVYCRLRLILDANEIEHFNDSFFMVQLFEMPEARIRPEEFENTVGLTPKEEVFASPTPITKTKKD
ncbi:unnamed protein product [Caenorhabditis bovis]|uniref:ANK_REP_REGION domain-containing protein n=1 Tax=Caenorhabditis bovis TaxID=2654633 RepID=A0A8S1E547_9PELO|nr:unnamed protein product [Caenorhabditis bovis]